MGIVDYCWRFALLALLQIVLIYAIVWLLAGEPDMAATNWL